MASLKQKAVKGVFWSAVDTFSSRGIQFVFGILIARQLLPQDYGAIALLQVFLAVSSTFIDSGFGHALIRKIDRTEKDINTVFYFNVAVSILCYCILFFLAPVLANFYKIPELVKITRVVGLSLIINSFAGIQNANLTINLNFKSFAKVSIVNATVSGLITLYLAHIGWGVWALVAQQIIQSILYVILIFFQSRWVPKLIFSWDSFKEMYSFGWKLLASSLIRTLYNNLYTLVVGKVYSPSDLGEFSKSQTFANFPSYNISSVIQRVTYPVLCQVQNDKERLSDYYRRLIKVMAFSVFPAMVGISAIAEPLVYVCLTEKWAGMIPYLQILPIAYIFAPIHSVNLNLLKVLGRSDYFLKLEIMKKIVGLTILCITVKLGLTVMCWGCLAGSIIALVINTYYTQRLIGYGFWAQIRDLLPTMLLCAFMGFAVFFSIKLLPTMLLRFIIGIIEGIVIYGLGAYLLRFKELAELKNLLFNNKKA